MRRLLITGASGFFGGRIRKYYSADYDVYAPSHAELDITDRETVRAAFQKYRPDIVIHSAAVSDTALCEREPERSRKINVDGSRNMAAASAEFHAKCLLCSSDQVYFGSALHGPHSEEESVAPCTVYGRQKKKAEEACLEQSQDCVVLRLSWMYDTESASRSEHSDFFRTLRNGLQTADILRYPVWDVRGITDVNEAVRNLEKAWDLPGGIYNFGSFNDKNTYETVLAVFAELGWDTKRLGKNEKAFAENPRNISMSLKKIQDNGIVFSSTREALVRSGRQCSRSFFP